MAQAEQLAAARVMGDSQPIDADFDGFFAASYDRLARALALTVGDAHLGADLVQEAMVRAYLRWPEVSGYANREGWVFRVGLNLARSRARRLWREWLGGHAEAVSSPPSPPADARLVAALDGLAAGQREVVVLRFWLDWSVEHTAEALGVAPGTVKSRTARALDALRDVLEVDDVDD